MTPAIVAELIHPQAEAAQFVPTKWDSAAVKAEFANKLLAFIASNFAEAKFTAKLYSRLSLTFGHIAHFNKLGFAQAQFSSTARRIEFLKQLAGWPCWGDPEFTYSDVERFIKARIIMSGAIEHLTEQRAAEVEARERAVLADLQAKYGGQPAPEPRLPSPPPIATDVAVVRRRLERQEAAKALQPTLF